MKKRFLLSLPVAAVLVLVVFWALAQPAPAPLASIFPAGALVYLEAKDLSSLLADWNASVEKRAWLESANYQVFSRSRLFLKLTEAQAEFATAAGVPVDYALLGPVAGTNSALSIYDIGSLEFLYITRLTSARAMDTALWKARSSYQTRNAGGVTYYVKEDKASHRLAAFAHTSDMLLLATKEELIAGALELLARQSRPAIVSEKWFADGVQAAPPGPRDLRLVYNLERLTRTPHFRSYWVQRNTGALREFSAGLADLERAGGELRERRVLLRGTPAADLSAVEAAAGELLALVPDDAGLYRVWARPAAAQAQRWIEEKLFATSVPAGPQSNQAPVVLRTPDAGGEQDLETRIDEPPLGDDRNARAFAALRERLSAARLDAMLEVSSARLAPDRVFVRPQSAIVLLASDAWAAPAVRDALTASVSNLWTSAGLGAGWRAGPAGVEQLDGLVKLAIAVDGRRLVIGDSVELVNAILARRNRAAAAGAVYAAGWRHARELSNFERLTRLIDFPQIPSAPAEAEQPAAREPMFFSENMASLGRALERVQSATIAAHDSGLVVRESVVYRFGP